MIIQATDKGNYLCVMLSISSKSKLQNHEKLDNSKDMLLQQSISTMTCFSTYQAKHKINHNNYSTNLVVGQMVCNGHLNVPKQSRTISRVIHIEIVANTNKLLHLELGCLQLGPELLPLAGLMGCHASSAEQQPEHEGKRTSPARGSGS